MDELQLLQLVDRMEIGKHYCEICESGAHFSKTCVMPITRPNNEVSLHIMSEPTELTESINYSPASLGKELNGLMRAAYWQAVRFDWC